MWYAQVSKKSSKEINYNKLHWKYCYSCMHYTLKYFISNIENHDYITCKKFSDIIFVQEVQFSDTFYLISDK